MWSQGGFRFDPGVSTELRTISKSNTNLLMEAARRLDEWRVLSKKIPSTDLVPEFVVQEHREGQINLNTSECSVKAIAAATRLSAFDAAKILYGLVATGLIRLRPAGSGPGGAGAARPAAPAAKPAAATRPAAAARTAGPSPPVNPSGAPAAHAPAAPAAPGPLGRLNRVREICNGLLGPAGESVVNKHYQKARAELERGAGPEAVEEAISQIARAASILKGPSTTETLLEQLKAIK